MAPWFGETEDERLQMSEGALWGGGSHDCTNPEGYKGLKETGQLIFAGKVDEAEALLATASKRDIAASSTWKIRLQRRLIESARLTSSVRHLFSIGRGSSTVTAQIGLFDSGNISGRRGERSSIQVWFCDG
jgi:hypothetical protein